MASEKTKPFCLKHFGCISCEGFVTVLYQAKGLIRLISLMKLFSACRNAGDRLKLWAEWSEWQIMKSCCCECASLKTGRGSHTCRWFNYQQPERRLFTNTVIFRITNVHQCSPVFTNVHGSPSYKQSWSWPTCSHSGWATTEWAWPTSASDGQSPARCSSSSSSLSYQGVCCC